jgi:hypothetical protein
MLMSAMPAHAEYSPAQKIIIAIENWRVRAKDCRTRYDSFTGAELTALTDFVIFGVQFAKFESSDVSDLMKAIEISVQNDRTPTKELCERLHTIIFGAP